MCGKSHIKLLSTCTLTYKFNLEEVHAIPIALYCQLAIDRFMKTQQIKLRLAPRYLSAQSFRKRVCECDTRIVTRVGEGQVVLYLTHHGRFARVRFLGLEHILRKAHFWDLYIVKGRPDHPGAVIPRESEGTQHPRQDVGRRLGQERQDGETHGGEKTRYTHRNDCQSNTGWGME